MNNVFFEDWSAIANADSLIELLRATWPNVFEPSAKLYVRDGMSRYSVATLERIRIVKYEPAVHKTYEGHEKAEEEAVKEAGWLDLMDTAHPAVGCLHDLIAAAASLKSYSNGDMDMSPSAAWWKGLEMGIAAGRIVGSLQGYTHPLQWAHADDAE